MSKSKITATRFAQILEKLGACDDARNWCRGKGFRVAWNNCPSMPWYRWLVSEINDLGISPLQEFDNEILENCGDVAQPCICDEIAPQFYRPLLPLVEAHLEDYARKHGIL